MTGPITHRRGTESSRKEAILMNGTVTTLMSRNADFSTTNALTAVAEGAAICPLWIEVPLEETEGLRQRVRSTGWPEKEIIADQ